MDNGSRELIHRGKCSTVDHGLGVIKRNVHVAEYTRNRIKGGAPTNLNPVAITSPVDSTVHAHIVVQRVGIIEQVSKHFISKPSVLGGETVSEKLYRKLVTSELPEYYDAIQNHVEIANASFNDFVVGTAIFYRSIVCLQARHGGFVGTHRSTYKVDAFSPDNAFDRRLSIDAAASTPNDSNTNFEIVKCEDTPSIANVLYGDSVYIIINGRHALGSGYDGRVDPINGRSLLPTLVNVGIDTQDANAAFLNFHFQNNECAKWVIFNRIDPSGTIGTVAKHGDKVLFCQEFVYLASPSPSELLLVPTKSRVDDILLKQHDFDCYRPPEDCTFTLNLVQQKNLGTIDAKKRFELAQRAESQLLTSRDRRKSVIVGRNHRLCLLVDGNVECRRVDQALHHKRNEHDGMVHLHNLYSTLSKNKFRDHRTTQLPIYSWRGLEAIRSAPSSPSRGYFFQNKTKSADLKENQESFGNSLNDRVIVFEKLEEEYWNLAQKVLLTCDAWVELTSAMKIYFDIAYDRTLKAVVIIQKFVRRKCNFSRLFHRSMRLADDATTMRLLMMDSWKQEFQYKLMIRDLVEKERIRKDLDSSYLLQQGNANIDTIFASRVPSRSNSIALPDKEYSETADACSPDFVPNAHFGVPKLSRPQTGRRQPIPLPNNFQDKRRTSQ